MVDDIPKNLQVLGNILKNENYNLEFATSGSNALNWLAKKEFDLILLDLMMPEMNGFEVCQAIRKNKMLDNMPIIFLTAKIDTQDIVKGFELGGQDYITKPFDARELLARVKTHLELRQSKKELNNMNKWLEKKVDERTVELKSANHNLTEANQKLKKLSDELLSLDTEKANFLRIISHEIRTPLNAILGFLGLIKSKIDNENLLNYFNYIDISSKRLENFSLQALLITELRTKTYKIEKNSIEIRPLIESYLRDEFADQIEQKNIKLSFKIVPEGLKLLTDRELFTKCISIIFDNAIKFSKIGGKIMVNASHKGPELHIEILDEGYGFSEKSLKNFRELFATGQEHINKNTGLDLAIACLIMDNHNGKLEVENNQKGGATVKLIFPNTTNNN